MGTAAIKRRNGAAVAAPVGGYSGARKPSTKGPAWSPPGHGKKPGITDIELGIYRVIGGLVVKGAKRSAILTRIMDFAIQATGTESGTLYLFDGASNELTFEVVKGPMARRFAGRRMRAEGGVASLVARTAKPYVSNDLKSDRFWTGYGGELPGRNLMAAPLVLRKKVIGVIEVINKKDGRPFTGGDLRVLKSLANHFSIVMERGNLFAALDDRVKQFETLNEVGNLLISTLDQGLVRHRAMEAVTRLMRAETGSLLIVDRKAGELYFEVALGEKGKTLKEVRLNIGEGIAGWVAKHGKPVIIHDVTKDRRFLGKIDRKSKFTTRDMVCVPVKIKGNVIGVLQAINRIGGHWTREDLKLFQLFSNQVAIALDNARLYGEIRDAFYATSQALAEAIEKRDPYTGGHTKRVLAYSLAIARELNLPGETVEVLKLSAVLHDIGKIGIEDRILRKEAPLDSEEAASMKLHPQLGAEILKHIPQLRDIMPGMLYHHERMDGYGYPEGLKGGKIPIVARIISVADTFDAMTTTRPYREGLPAKDAFRELRKHSGTQFDGKVVDALIKAHRNGRIENLTAAR